MPPTRRRTRSKCYAVHMHGMRLKLPIQKQWFNRIWFAFGRWYVYGTDQPPRLVERAWVQSVHPPYFRGTGWAVRVGRYSLRVGLGRANSTVVDDEADEESVKAELAAVGWRLASDHEQEVIRATWESSTEPEKHATE